MLGAKTTHTAQKSTGLKSSSLCILKMAPKLNRKEQTRDPKQNFLRDLYNSSYEREGGLHA